MSVTLNLTTRQQPIFNKAMREAKLKLAAREGSVELDAKNFGEVADAIMGAYMRETLSEGPNEDNFMHIANKIAGLEHLFPEPQNITPDEVEPVKTQIKDWPEND